MSKGRLEAFSDGVVAILITIMVLGLGVPHGTDLAAITPLWPVLLSYVLSFVNLAIWWNNHHHLFQAIHHVNGRVLWANLHLLFWLSLLPWSTAWMGENEFAPLPVAIYGAILFCSAIAYTLLVWSLVALEGGDSLLGQALGGRDLKGRGSLVAYGVAAVVALVAPYVAIAIYVVVAGVWFVPDLRIARRLPHETHAEASGEVAHSGSGTRE